MLHAGACCRHAADRRVEGSRKAHLRRHEDSGSEDGRTRRESSAAAAAGDDDDDGLLGMGATRFLIVTLRKMMDVSVSALSLRLELT